MSDELRKQKVERVTAALLDLLRHDEVPVVAELAELDPLRPFTRAELEQQLPGLTPVEVDDLVASMINTRLGSECCTGDMVNLAQRYWSWVCNETLVLAGEGKVVVDTEGRVVRL